MPAPSKHPRDPLHGVTLEKVLMYLQVEYGWPEMARRIPIRCFTWSPSIKSSLRFLRQTPWARQKVEEWYALDQWKKQDAQNAAGDPDR